MNDHIYLTVGPNCWGKGLTPDESLRNARKEFPRWSGRRALKKYFKTKRVHNSAAVDSVSGWITWDGTHDAKSCPLCEVGKETKAIP